MAHRYAIAMDGQVDKELVARALMEKDIIQSRSRRVEARQPFYDGKLVTRNVIRNAIELCGFPAF